MRFFSTRTTSVIAAVAALTVGAFATAQAHTGTPGMPMTTHPAPAKMTIKAVVTKDAKAGYNLQVKTTRFRWAPWNASGTHRQGQGHAHLFINGKKITRLYSSWYFLGDLKKGRNVIKVTLNGNDHGDYVRNMKPIASTRVITVK